MPFLSPTELATLFTAFSNDISLLLILEADLNPATCLPNIIKLVGAKTIILLIKVELPDA